MAEESTTTQRNNTLSNNGKYLDPKADVTFKLVFGVRNEVV